jgi:hypothetical protein
MRDNDRHIGTDNDRHIGTDKRDIFSHPQPQDQVWRQSNILSSCNHGQWEKSVELILHFHVVYTLKCVQTNMHSPKYLHGRIRNSLGRQIAFTENPTKVLRKFSETDDCKAIKKTKYVISIILNWNYMKFSKTNVTWSWSRQSATGPKSQSLYPVRGLLFL